MADENISIADLLKQIQQPLNFVPPGRASVPVPPIKAPVQAPQPPVSIESVARQNFTPPDPNLRNQGDATGDVWAEKDESKPTDGGVTTAPPPDKTEGPAKEIEKTPSFQERNLAPTEPPPAETKPLTPAPEHRSITDIIKPIAPAPNKGLLGISGWDWASLAPGKLGDLFAAKAESVRENQPAYEIGGEKISRAQLGALKAVPEWAARHYLAGSGGEYKTEEEASLKAAEIQKKYPNAEVSVKQNPKTGMFGISTKYKTGAAGEKFSHGTVTIGDNTYPSRTEPKSGEVEYRDETGWHPYLGSKAKKTGEQSKEDARQAIEHLDLPMDLKTFNKLSDADKKAIKQAESHNIIGWNADKTRLAYASMQKEPGQIIIDRRDEGQISPSEVRSVAMNVIANPRLAYSLMRGNKAMQKAVSKELDKIEQEGGLPPGGASAILGTMIEGNRQAYIQQTKNEAGVKVFESQFTRNSNAALQMSDQYSRTKYPDFNTLKNLYNTKTGDPDVTAFKYQTYIMMLENLKISTSGQQITSAELSITAQKKADELVNSTFNWDQYKSTVKDMQMDTSHRMLSYGATKTATKNSLTEALGGQPLPKVDDPTMVKGTLKVGNMNIETTVTKETSDMWSAEKKSAWTPAKKESNVGGPLPYSQHLLTPTPTYKTKDDVTAAYKSGKLKYEDAEKILREQFGVK